MSAARTALFWWPTGPDLWQQASFALGADVPAVLLVNKFDLVDEWDISPELIESINRSIPVFCTSAKTGESVEQAFSTLAEAVAA
jgi:signal recognition particle receptor subunit beta